VSSADVEDVDDADEVPLLTAALVLDVPLVD